MSTLSPTPPAPQLLEAFRSTWGGQRVSGCRVELIAASPSRVELTPAGGRPVRVVTLHSTERALELRAFEEVRTLPMDRETYRRLLERLQAFFATHGYTARRPSVTRGVTSGTLVIVVVLLAAAASSTILVWYLTHR